MRRRPPPRRRSGGRRAAAAEDAFRRAHGLLAAEDAERWLAEHGVSVGRWRTWVRHTVQRTPRARAVGRRLGVTPQLVATMRAATPSPDVRFAAAPIDGTLPIVTSRVPMDCAAAALASVCRAFGVPATLAEVRRAIGAGPDGASLAGLAGGARALGLDAQPIKASARNLAELPLPAIAHVDGDHWIVVSALADGAADVYDPAYGRATVPLEQLAARWTGYTLLVARRPASRG